MNHKNSSNQEVKKYQSISVLIILVSAAHTSALFLKHERRTDLASTFKKIAELIAPFS